MEVLNSPIGWKVMSEEFLMKASLYSCQDQTVFSLAFCDFLSHLTVSYRSLNVFVKTKCSAGFVPVAFMFLYSGELFHKGIFSPFSVLCCS